MRHVAFMDISFRLPANCHYPRKRHMEAIEISLLGVCGITLLLVCLQTLAKARCGTCCKATASWSAPLASINRKTASCSPRCVQSASM